MSVDAEIKECCLKTANSFDGYRIFCADSSCNKFILMQGKNKRRGLVFFWLITTILTGYLVGVFKDCAFVYVYVVTLYVLITTAELRFYWRQLMFVLYQMLLGAITVLFATRSNIFNSNVMTPLFLSLFVTIGMVFSLIKLYNDGVEKVIGPKIRPFEVKITISLIVIATAMYLVKMFYYFGAVNDSTKFYFYFNKVMVIRHWIVALFVIYVIIRALLLVSLSEVSTPKEWVLPVKKIEKDIVDGVIMRVSNSKLAVFSSVVYVVLVASVVFVNSVSISLNFLLRKAVFLFRVIWVYSGALYAILKAHYALYVLFWRDFVLSHLLPFALLFVSFFVVYVASYGLNLYLYYVAVGPFMVFVVGVLFSALLLQFLYLFFVTKMSSSFYKVKNELKRLPVNNAKDTMLVLFWQIIIVFVASLVLIVINKMFGDLPYRLRLVSFTSLMMAVIGIVVIYMVVVSQDGVRGGGDA